MFELTWVRRASREDYRIQGRSKANEPPSFCTTYQSTHEQQIKVLKASKSKKNQTCKSLARFSFCLQIRDISSRVHS